jgi:transposase
LIQGWETRRSALNRLVLKDEQWERIAPLLPGKAGDPGRSGSDNRRFLEAVLWMVRTGAPWRDLPEAFGSWNSVFRRFRRWAQASVFERLFLVLSGDPDFEYALIDGTIIRVHQHGTGAKGGLVVRRSGARAAA